MKTRVLMADDEAEVLDSLATLLDAAKYAVVGKARSGAEACRLAAEQKPDVILLDIKMPDMDGLRATESIMEASPTPVVLCTAYCDDDLLYKAAKAGAYNYIIKPFRLAELVAAIAIAMARYADAVRLRSEIDRLGVALENRKWVERAKGIIMKVRKLDEKQAHRYLELESQRRGQPMADLARALVAAHELLQSHNATREREIGPVVK